ncbi:MAG: PilZ domain-containing protein [Saprospiraceae bacterium]|nr:PilZ domain-containing protein [Pyrinomonadaceae bacterium]
MIRELVSKISSLFAERSHATRRKFEAPIKIWFDLVPGVFHANSAAKGSFMTGVTSDLSGSGIGFIVSAIRIKENYLVGQNRELNVELDLPGGKIRMKVMGRRYEKFGMHISTEKYAIGAEIIDMSKEDRDAYEHFLLHSRNLKKNIGGSLELEVD